MQNFIKSQTRLAFIQFIFQNEFLNTDTSKNIDDFQNYFYDTNISVIANNPTIATRKSIPSNK